MRHCLQSPRLLLSIRITLATVTGVAAVAFARADGAELHLGAATADITPEGPVALTGFKTVRISRRPLSPCTVNVLAFEALQGKEIVDQAILVSCDLCVIRAGIQEGFRQHVASRLPGFDLQCRQNTLLPICRHLHNVR